MRMLDFKEKRRLRKILYAKTTLVLLFAVLLLLMGGTWDIFQKNRETHVKKDEVAQELRQLETRAEELEGDIARLESERGLEEEIRSRFMVAKEGEQVVMIIDDGSEDDAAQLEEPEKKSIIKRLLGALGFE